MIKTTEVHAETTAVDDDPAALDDALRAMRVRGNLLLREAYAPPWAIDIPRCEDLSNVLGMSLGTRVVAFHLVEFGHCTIRSEKGVETQLTAGEMAVCFGGEAHRLFQGETSRPQSIETLLAGGRNLQRPEGKDRSVGASLLCGVFLLQHTALNPLFDALPPMLRSTLSRAGEFHNLSGIARLIAEEMDRRSAGGEYVIERYLEVLCAEAVRAHIETTSRQEPSWFQGIRDPVVGRAISAVHVRPGENWSVRRLASRVAMSPSRFAARFSKTVGKSPMSYVAEWRMNVACRVLATSSQSIDQIATKVGYESPAAFSRAFKKHLGMAPATWRAHEKSV